MEHLEQLLSEYNLLSHLNSGIRIITTTQEKGLIFTGEFLTRVVDSNSLLLLSGGRTPKELYTTCAKEEKLRPGAVGQIDERYGKDPFHKNSNQKMIRETELLRYLQMLDIPFYPILPSHGDLRGGAREDIASAYDTKLRELFGIYRRTIGILGVGLDGHTAGLPAQSSKLKVESLKLHPEYEYVTSYDDKLGSYGERVTMTFLGLSMLDLFIVLVFGDDKKDALELMFEDRPEVEVPARFYRRPDIAKKTILITDQKL